MNSMCGVQLKDWNRAKGVTLLLVLNETVDWLATVHCVHWYGHVLWCQDSHVLRMASQFEVEGQMKKRRPNRIGKKQVEEEILKVDLGGKISTRLKGIWPTLLVGDGIGFQNGFL